MKGGDGDFKSFTNFVKCRKKLYCNFYIKVTDKGVNEGNPHANPSVKKVSNPLLRI